MTSIKCNSPINGSVYVERPIASLAETRECVHKAKADQQRWAERPLRERIDLVKAGVAAISAMNDEIITELAWQMGRPVRYGGEFSGFEERALHMINFNQ